MRGRTRAAQLHSSSSSALAIIQMNHQRRQLYQGVEQITEVQILPDIDRSLERMLELLPPSHVIKGVFRWPPMEQMIRVPRYARILPSFFGCHKRVEASGSICGISASDKEKTRLVEAECKSKMLSKSNLRN